MEVTIADGRRLVRVTGTQEDLPEILEVKWSKAPVRTLFDERRG
jgi:hypothetical protein